MSSKVSNPALTATICDLEHQAWKALCTSGSALLPLLSSNPVMIFPGDMIFTATSSPTLHDMMNDPSFQPWKSYKLSHDEVIPLGSGQDSALVYYRVEAIRDDTTFKAICSSVWVNDEGGWKMASHQQTLI